MGLISLQLLIITGLLNAVLVLETHMLHTINAGLQKITSCTMEKKKKKKNFIHRPFYGRATVI